MTATTIIRDSLTDTHLADYLTAPWGHYIGVYADGSIHVGESIGREIDPGERPVATAKCPGIGNLDSTYWTADFCEQSEETGLYIVTGKFMDDKSRVVGTLEDVIRESCENGDVGSELEELIGRLEANAAL